MTVDVTAREVGIERGGWRRVIVSRARGDVLEDTSQSSSQERMRLPHSHNVSLESRQRSEDHDSLHLPAFTLTDVAEQAPRPTRFATVTPVETYRRPRRLSLPPLSMFARSHSTGPRVRWRTSASTTGLVIPSEVPQQPPTLPTNPLPVANNPLGDPLRRGSRESLVATSELRRALDRILSDNGFGSVHLSEGATAH